MRSLTQSVTVLSAVCGILIPQRAACQHVGTQRTVTADSCLPPSEFQLRGIAITSLSSEALETLGMPLRVTTDSGEDDGGRYEIQTFHYSDLEFNDVRGFVDRLATKASTVASPSGLRPGLSFSALRQVLATQGVRLKQPADTIEITTCDMPDAGIVLTLDRSQHVRALVIAAARP